MKTARVLVLGTAAMVSACHGDSGTPDTNKPQLNTAAAVKKGPSAQELTAGMVEAASSGKSQLAVQLKFDLPQRPIVGRTIDVNLAILPQIDANSLGIQVSAGDGLTAAADAGQLEMPIEAGQVYRQNVKVTLTAEGVQLLSLTVSLKHDDLTESRAFSIPLIVER
jgi:hypothetical protein